jgi:putative transposase
MVAARGRTASTRKVHARLRAELDEARTEISGLEEELRLKDLRMGRMNPRRRPHYRPMERMAILELRASRGWSTVQVAKRFLLQSATIADWMKRVDVGGERVLLETSEPVNRFPDFVRYAVQRLKTLCPSMGKKRIAQTLARAGLHLGVTTVGRILQERLRTSPEPAAEVLEARRYRPVTAKYRHHVWQIDLTIVPTSAGFWTPWIPNALSQVWPFCWWVGCVVDQYSRRVIGFAVFRKQPTSLEIRSFLGRAIGRAKAAPRYLLSDKGGQFDCPAFRQWCRRKGIRPRYAAAGRRGATAIIERFFRSLKDEWLRRIMIPLRPDALQRELSSYLAWFHEHRPHQGVGGRTPSEMHDGLWPANEDSRIEPRPRWPEDSLCALPTAKIGHRSTKFQVILSFHDGSRHLPKVEVKQAA